jgi:16S rRNA (uracil1498-N3)-methyltransferase
LTLPYFFVEDLNTKKIILDEDTSKHISVLRMQKGEQILLTDGKGKKAQANIIDDNRKKCMIEIFSVQNEEERKRSVAIGISLLKNTSRFEWFLEKATEIGVSEIIPLLCERTEKEKFRFDRMQQILISAMLQSQQCWLPVLHQPTEFKNIITKKNDRKFIAHCIDEEKTPLTNEQINQSTSVLILIGPEGDFTEKEIAVAIENIFQPISLGSTRLRTETAGMFAAVVLCNPPG